ncbi:angiotensin-converting enzyme-like protein Ace3 [Chelonus insularis]|uniref:angiotensin-converting enzyme-like protein Ace3 n=1 Tax=Chelonus insularis TaxID=460826 RepID=UPI001589D20B|nr:angiotensin-converting enzyme-like protein Ace3 [Chelonus insularis]
MNLKWCYVITGLFVIATSTSNTSNESHLETSLQFVGYDYGDECNNTAESHWIFIQHPNKNTLKLWKTALNNYASLKRKKKDEVEAEKSVLMNGTELSPSTGYEFDLVTKPGDALLNPEDWSNFISFIGEAELLRFNGNHTTGVEHLHRKDAETVLAHIGTAENKLKFWTLWHQSLMPLIEKFPDNLQYVQKAAITNGAKDVEEYWQILCGYENGYTQMKTQWMKISNIHSKLVKFVHKRLSFKYKDAIESDTLPAHLLGTLQSTDWTPLAMDVIPNFEYIYTMRKNLLEKNMAGLNLYKSASGLAKIVLKHVPEAQFFNESNFQGQCPSHLINFCKEGKVRVITCSESSITNYLSAHKDIAKVMIHQMSDETSPILNIENRYSAIEEGVSELFGILAASPAWLSTLNLTNETKDPDELQIISIMITALDILPRLAYYFSGDMWRIDTIKNNTFNPEHLTTSWWKYRLEYEKINTSDVKLPTFIDDEYIIKNKPYLPKFIGIILGFQMYEYLMKTTDVKTDHIGIRSVNHHFIKMIKHGTAKNWHYTMEKYLKIYDVSVTSLVNYFSPLEDFLDEFDYEEDVNLPLELEKELELLEDDYKKNINKPVTTSTTPTTIITTTIATTTSKDLTIVPKIKVSPTSDHTNKRRLDAESTNSQSVNSSFVHNDNATSQSHSIGNSDQVISDSEETIEVGNRLIKNGISAAVWAVGSVLLATIAIVLIAIFGRQRCQKTPKNRRYV